MRPKIIVSSSLIKTDLIRSKDSGSPASIKLSDGILDGEQRVTDGKLKRKTLDETVLEVERRGSEVGRCVRRFTL